MLRDGIKDSHYFERYMALQKGRIERYSAKLTQDMNESSVQFYHSLLCGFEQNLLSAQYSAGSDIDTIRETFRQYLQSVTTQPSLTFNMASFMLSMGILFDINVSNVFQKASVPADSLLKELYFYNKNGELQGDAASGLLLPKIYMSFATCLDGNLSAEELRFFVEHDWYDLNSDETWYNSHQESENSYCGYWCFLGAAIAKIRRFNPSSFTDATFFPVDLL